jgi:transposase InsO family protein
MKLWHERLGHPSEKVMQEMIKRGLLPISDLGLPFCEACQKGKAHREAAEREAPERAKEIYELVHTDILGPVTPSTRTGKSYAIIFVDDYTRFRVTYLMKKRSEAATCLQTFIIEEVRPKGLRMQRIRADNGAEFTGASFGDVCAAAGAKREFSAPYTQSQNGVSERTSRAVTSSIPAIEDALPLYHRAVTFFTARLQAKGGRSSRGS